MIANTNCLVAWKSSALNNVRGDLFRTSDMESNSAEAHMDFDFLLDIKLPLGDDRRVSTDDN